MATCLCATRSGLWNRLADFWVRIRPLPSSDHTYTTPRPMLMIYMWTVVAWKWKAIASIQGVQFNSDRRAAVSDLQSPIRG